MPAAGHPGTYRTCEIIKREFDWPGLYKYVKDYVRSCDLCQRIKLVTHAPYGPLLPPRVPDQNWESISIDFLSKLPPSNDFTTIIVFCDRRSKRAHFIACSDDLDGYDFAQIFLEEVFRLHGLPSQIISDRGVQFVNHFFSRLCSLLNIEHTPSTAFHQRTNGQAERTIQTLEAYLRCFTDYRQDDWHAWLPLAEFAFNNLANASTGISPFEADGVVMPRFNYHFEQLDSTRKADSQIARRKQVDDEINAAIQHAQETQAKYFNKHVKDMPELQVGQKVMLLRHNIKTNRPTMKLDYTRLGPFKILAIEDRNVTLELGAMQRNIHPTFHISLVEPYTSPSSVPNRIKSIPPLEAVVDRANGISHILNSQRRGRGVRYLVLRDGQPEHEADWVPFSDLAHDLEVVSKIMQFHADQPNTPQAQQLSQYETTLIPAPQHARGPTLRQDRQLRPIKLVRKDGNWANNS